MISPICKIKTYIFQEYNFCKLNLDQICLILLQLTVEVIWQIEWTVAGRNGFLLIFKIILAIIQHLCFPNRGNAFNKKYRKYEKKRNDQSKWKWDKKNGSKKENYNLLSSIIFYSYQKFVMYSTANNQNIYTPFC